MRQSLSRLLLSAAAASAQGPVDELSESDAGEILDTAQATVAPQAAQG